MIEAAGSVENNRNWTTIDTTGGGNGGTDNLTGLSGSGRYIRNE